MSWFRICGWQRIKEFRFCTPRCGQGAWSSSGVTVWVVVGTCPKQWTVACWAWTAWIVHLRTQICYNLKVRRWSFCNVEVTDAELHPEFTAGFRNVVLLHIFILLFYMCDLWRVIFQEGQKWYNTVIRRGTNKKDANIEERAGLHGTVITWHHHHHHLFAHKTQTR